jgi:hypothetical protein
MLLRSFKMTKQYYKHPQHDHYLVVTLTKKEFKQRAHIMEILRY